MSEREEDQLRSVALSNVKTIVAARKRAEKELREAKEALRQLADAMPQIVWSASADGQVDYLNGRWYESTGLSDEESKSGSGAWIHPDDREAYLCAWEHSRVSGEPFEHECRLRMASGEYRWHLTRAIRMDDEDGTQARWYGSSTDIDDRKAMEERLREESRTLEVLNRTGNAIGSSLDLESLLQTITDAATEICGAQFGAFFYNALTADGECLTLYTLSGAPREAVAHLGHPRPTDLFGPTFRGEDPIRSEDILQDPRYGNNAPHGGMPKGHLPVRSYLAVPVISRSGKVIGGLFFGHSQTAVFSERSERLAVGVAGQAAVAIDNAELYEDVKRAARQREELLQAERGARLEAERMSRVKDEFLATLSHELRTPLMPILGWVHILKSGKINSDKGRQGLEVIERSAKTQTRLIDDLLDMSRIVSGKINIDISTVDLVEVINNVVVSVKLSAEAKQIRLRTDIEVMVQPIAGDPARLQQVFWNLLTNAIKFTPTGGNVTITLDQVDNQVVVSVADSGPGISETFLPYIFDRFRQADASSTRAHGGLGLGLSIAKQLVELHGGSIEARSSGEGHGATFTVALPAASDDRLGREPPARPVATRAERSLRGVKVLVLDDDADSRDLLRSILNDHEAQVAAVGSADEALRLVPRFKPQVLVSDIGLPGKDGYQFMRELRALSPDHGGNVPALALSAFARPEDRAKALGCGFHVYASKPIDPEELTKLICELAFGWGGSDSVQRQQTQRQQTHRTREQG